MDEELKRVKYSCLRWNSPLSEDHAGTLLEHLQLEHAQSIVDLGCGWGEILLRAAETSQLAATGVDTDQHVIERARQAAADRRLMNVSFVRQPAQNWNLCVDRAICIGSSHTLGGTRSMLNRLAEIVPRGRVLIGDTCWEKPPTQTAGEAFSEVEHLMDLVAVCQETGWEILHLSVADQQEWDDFESGYRRGIREWLMDNRHHPKADEIREQQNSREREYFTTYRGILSFVYLVLGR